MLMLLLMPDSVWSKAMMSSPIGPIEGNGHIDMRTIVQPSSTWLLLLPKMLVLVSNDVGDKRRHKLRRRLMKQQLVRANLSDKDLEPDSTHWLWLVQQKRKKKNKNYLSLLL